MPIETLPWSWPSRVKLVSNSPHRKPRASLFLSSDRQHVRLVKLGLMRRIITSLLEECGIVGGDLHVSLVNAKEITRLNETFLHHRGSTDVITFDYSIGGRSDGLSGEIFVCLDEAFSQAVSFRTTWQSELVRYIVHGILHLLGYDDGSATARAKMKRAEDRLMRRLAKRFDLNKLSAGSSDPDRP